MPRRVLDYTGLIWRHHPGGGGLLPLVIPIVIYPGPGRWSGPRRLRELIAIPPGLGRWAGGFAPDCGFLLVELAELDAGELSGGAASRAVLLALKQERAGKLDAAVVDEVLGLLVGDHGEIVVRVLESIWVYFLYNADLSQPEAHVIVEKHIPEPQRTTAMTLAQRLFQEGQTEGLQEGLQKGLHRGRQEAILTVLKTRFKRVPPGLKEAVRAVENDKQLARLVSAAATCCDIEDFAAKLP